jgi:hypothetical protein
MLYSQPCIPSDFIAKGNHIPYSDLCRKLSKSLADTPPSDLFELKGLSSDLPSMFASVNL